jgi:cysteine synthase A
MRPLFEGGTIAGVSSFLKRVEPRVQCFLADPVGSSLLSFVESKGQILSPTPGSTLIEGIGINRITANFKNAELDGALNVTDREAVEMAYYLVR